MAAAPRSPSAANLNTFTKRRIFADVRELSRDPSSQYFDFASLEGGEQGSGLDDKSKRNFIILYFYFCGIWPVLGCIDADLCK